MNAPIADVKLSRSYSPGDLYSGIFYDHTNSSQEIQLVLATARTPGTRPRMTVDDMRTFKNWISANNLQDTITSCGIIGR